MKTIQLSAQMDEELFVCQCGTEACEPAHAFGPAVRDHYLIHFVASGSGTFQSDGHSYEVGAGQGFLITPGEETFYQASASDPWHYAWVGYRGRRAEAITKTAGLDAFHRVFTCSDPKAAWSALETMRNDARTLRLSQMAAVGSLYRFFSLIAPPQDPYEPVTPGKQYCDKARWFLEGRFDREVSIQETADFVGLSRSHLYRIMLEECGCSPKEMLLQIRMRNAKKLLRETTLTLDEIAHRVGFCNGTQFGAAFRSVHGTTPGKYRREQEAKIPQITSVAEQVE